ncbi:unnamed protein product [Camellia sinensis]
MGEKREQRTGEEKSGEKRNRRKERKEEKEGQKEEKKEKSKGARDSSLEILRKSLSGTGSMPPPRT